MFKKYMEFSKAVDEYRSAIRLAPDNIEARKELAGLLDTKGLQPEAEAEYREILRLDGSDQKTRNLLISIYVRKKNYDGIIQLLKENVGLAPNEANSHYRRGIAYHTAKDYQSAASEYEKTISLKPDHAKALYAYGKLSIKHGYIEKAKKLLEAARTADPDFKEPVELLSSLHDDLGLRSEKKSSGNAKPGRRKKLANKKKNRNKARKA